MRLAESIRADRFGGVPEYYGKVRPFGDRVRRARGSGVSLSGGHMPSQTSVVELGSSHRRVIWLPPLCQ
jgi:hypothetical protein